MVLLHVALDATMGATAVLLPLLADRLALGPGDQAALFATLMFAALDTFSFVMVFPFLQALFEGGSVELDGAGERIEALLENTIGRLLVPGADPMQAITALCIAIAIVFLFAGLAMILFAVLAFLTRSYRTLSKTFAGQTESVKPAEPDGERGKPPDGLSRRLGEV